LNDGVIKRTASKKSPGWKPGLERHEIRLRRFPRDVLTRIRVRRTRAGELAEASRFTVFAAMPRLQSAKADFVWL